jgi:ABC-2 type transport system ATP-binding protein
MKSVEVDSTPLPQEGAAPRPPPIVEVRGLSKNYGDTLAVRDLSFQVAAGEIFGFIGPNGAGKTTTLRVLATLLEPTAGDVYIDGRCVVNETDQVRRVIGYMPDCFGVYDGITVAEYLDFFASAYGLRRLKRKAILQDVLDLTDMGSLRDRMVSSLSKGMKQRLCLAKTLVHDPKVLILDEPASALDPRARIEMRFLLKELRQMGKTILISSHILTELSDLCDSVAIIEKGQLVECGRMDLLHENRWGVDRVKVSLHEPRDGVEAILAQSPLVESVAVEESRVLFDYTGSPAEFFRVIKLFTDHEIPILAVERESRNLEDLFMKLTRGDVQ